MSLEDNPDYFSDDDLFDSVFTSNSHIILGTGPLKAKKDEEQKIEYEELSIDYFEKIQKLYIDMKMYVNVGTSDLLGSSDLLGGLDLLENSDFELFKNMMMFYKK